MMCLDIPFVSPPRAMDRAGSLMFDDWLRTTLRRNFDHALDEPVPHELEAILGVIDPRSEH